MDYLNFCLLTVMYCCIMHTIYEWRKAWLGHMLRRDRFLSSQQKEKYLEKDLRV